uniref:Uncharacterized protein n=1 Tax=Anguilla anguilla TaxID=7936 RepID=A0A0E9U161_ANGAN
MKILFWDVFISVVKFLLWPIILMYVFYSALENKRNSVISASGI